jgi:hypothetical protein
MSAQTRNSRGSHHNLRPTLGTVAVFVTLAALAIRLASSVALFGLLRWATWAVWQVARLPLVVTQQDTLPACLQNAATFYSLASKMAVCISAILRLGAS